MYQINMDNLYFRGIREIVPKNYRPKINSSRFICDGVMLMNLKLIREEHFYDNFRNYYLKLKKNIIYLDDQLIINTLFRDKIDFLPPKFGIWFMNEENIKEYNSLNPIIYTIDELKEANNKPIIRHLWGKTQEGIDLLFEKPWLLKKSCKIKEEWQYYANKTGYYDSICKFFKNSCLNYMLIQIIIEISK
jgi:lipopolysaccharide biosynthesis glycosyltransferase